MPNVIGLVRAVLCIVTRREGLVDSVDLLLRKHAGIEELRVRSPPTIQALTIMCWQPRTAWPRQPGARHNALLALPWPRLRDGEGRLCDGRLYSGTKLWRDAY